LAGASVLLAAPTIGAASPKCDPVDPVTCIAGGDPMCGIAGIWTHGAFDPSAARAMADALAHRGPDDAGVWEDRNAGIALAHRRLAIIDLSSAGHQPMVSACGRYVCSFNGEIYNHLVLRRELERETAIDWHGHSDTETLLHAVARWGLAGALTRATGMFALAIWDRDTETLSLARDRIGEKPLYYGWTGGRIVFASELKALRAIPGAGYAVDPDVLGLYFRTNYVPAPWSILKGIYKVEPGVIVTIDAAALATPAAVAPRAAGAAAVGVACSRYWSLGALAARPADETMDAETAVADLEARLADAIREQVVADVPVGAFLSGGVDSSTIVALMRNLTDASVRTFTIGFDQPGFDEAPHARAVARHLGTEHDELYVTPEDVRAVIAELPRIYDEPFADSSQIPTVLLSRMARRSVTVALSGDAGDELFCGYNRYLVSRRVWRAAGAIPVPLRHAIGRGVARVPPTAWDRVARWPLLPDVPMLGAKARKAGRILQTPLDAIDIYRASSEEWQDGVPVSTATVLRSPIDDAAPGRATAEERMMQWDMMSYLPDDILTKVDRATMASGLEARVPFLDPRVVEQAWRTPLRYKKRAGQGKWLLRQILYRHVPSELIERPKAGFAIPIGAWLRGPLRDWAEGLLSESALARDPALDRGAIRRRWAQHLAGRHDWTASLWGVLMYRAWATEWAAPC
jgi:asparagine synthase (glutamine-hydrolysing)